MALANLYDMKGEYFEGSGTPPFWHADIDQSFARSEIMYPGWYVFDWIENVQGDLKQRGDLAKAVEIVWYIMVELAAGLFTLGGTDKLVSASVDSAGRHILVRRSRHTGCPPPRLLGWSPREQLSIEPVHGDLADEHGCHWLTLVRRTRH